MMSAANTNESTIFFIFASILLISLIYLLCFIRANKKGELTQHPRPPINADEAQQLKKWRKLLSVSENDKLYKVCDIYATYDMRCTSQEVAVIGELRKSIYFSPFCILADSFFKKTDGKYSQIDIIAVNKRGIFVIECKDYQGWIFGNGKNSRWTESLPGNGYAQSKKFYFYNPIFQNNSHIKAIKNVLPKELLSRVNFHSLILFSNSTILKDINMVPNGTYVATQARIHQVLTDICKNDECLTAKEVSQIVTILHRKRITPTDEIRNDQIDKIKDLIGVDRVYN